MEKSHNQKDLSSSYEPNLLSYIFINDMNEEIEYTLNKFAGWRKVGGSGWHTRKLCCHSARLGHAGELGREEPYEVQQEQVQNPTPGKK